MSIEDYAKSLLTEVAGKPASKTDVPESAKDDRAEKPEPNKPDPEEVQYPGYFEGHGRL
ncbi:hypothetical protein QO002_004489 [Pararhizobium capsulatum DSM 1112]|uniref:Uncharacterized protein n=1 Tax=Pararhizobium capsulatum DSM 1112 TaxID=1121113 RepID=A0ABU0BWF0_9HYPH|nr:hypothetical protein [Pararhizobium capsulatum]MDQ0322283.1 hypothetical protein [Pararhizobium capsulatum DSM 1112]